MLDLPSLEHIGPLVLIGAMRSYGRGLDQQKLVHGIGQQWNDYMMRRVAPPWTPNAWRYGVTMRMADGDVAMSYFCGAPPPEPLENPPGFIALTIPALPFAVFPFDSHIAELRDFVHMVFARALPEAGLKPAADAPNIPEFIERYDWRFNPSTGRGGFDLLIPVAG
jgi:predicted transcriptional regulator YdeE